MIHRGVAVPSLIGPRTMVVAIRQQLGMTMRVVVMAQATAATVVWVAEQFPVPHSTVQMALTSTSTLGETPMRQRPDRSHEVQGCCDLLFAVGGLGPRRLWRWRFGQFCL